MRQDLIQMPYRLRMLCNTPFFMQHTKGEEVDTICLHGTKEEIREILEIENNEQEQLIKFRQIYQLSKQRALDKKKKKKKK